jgi:hypothetical protein
MAPAMPQYVWLVVVGSFAAFGVSGRQAAPANERG